jgi:glycosyltransferase involved in cell wall biosynthesis/GT2 family glycosyltransferase
VPSAHFLLCRALLEAGHHLDLYAVPSYIPDPGYPDPRFRYVAVDVDAGRRFNGTRLPADLRLLADSLAGRRDTDRSREAAIAAARARHSVCPYDAALFLGMPPRSTIDGVPTFVWPECGPQTELDAVRGLSKPIARVSGRAAYLKLRLYYEIKDRLVWEWARSHHLIVASWLGRQQAIAFGVPAERICVVPYPIDLHRFTVGEIPSGATRRVLCVGRLDPRKRIDLLIDAVAILARRRNDFRVEVIGRDGYLPGWGGLVQAAGRHLPISYTAAIPQSQLIGWLREADIVVQPSEHEEFGHAVAEALACGIPVVTGPTNGTGAYAPANGSAKFEHYTPESLARAIERALAMSRNQSARAACRTAAEAFTADRVATRVSEFINRSLPNADRPADGMRQSTPPVTRRGRTPSVSVIVPTYRRIDRLAVCLEGLRSQSRRADEVIVVVQAGDEPTARFVGELAGAWPELRCERVARHGLVAALNCGLAGASGTIVAFVDDDAVPTVGWLERIVETFERDDCVAAVGGRDLVFEDGRVVDLEPRRRLGVRRGQPRVGRIQWCGRMLGNHHVGIGAARDVDVLKGANMSFRREAVVGHGFDERLRGDGVQMHSELSICLPLRRRGLRIVYDPDISVLHHPAPRRLGHERDDASAEAVASTTHNEALAILDYFRPARRIVFMVWGIGVGTSSAPGLAVLARDLLHRRPTAWMRFRAAQHGRLAAWLSHRRTQRINGLRAEAR